MTTKILVLSSNPHNTEQLGLNREFSEIENARESSRNKDQFTVLRVAQARVDHLQREILETKARIVHFCGHGLGNQGLVLETKDGQQQLVSTEALADLFKLLAHQVECVILNACYSEAQAAAIDQYINYVIGTNNAIKDNVAIAFSQGFYTGLFSGKGIEDAYQFAKNRIQLKIYDKPGQQRKLTVEGIELPEAELFTFKIKNPLNQIESEEATTTTPQHTPSNLIQPTAANFIGREKQLEQVHQLLQNNEQVSISAIAGMGGIGKTELAIQYALNHQEYYSGSISWFSARGENLGIQIIEFARSCLKIFPPEQLDTEQAKLNYCWQYWHEPSLIILDDVPDYGQFYQEKIKPYLPPGTNNIKVLMTSREHPGSIAKIDLDVLEADQALELLQSLIGKPRIDAEPEKAQELCAWLGFLPLGIELVGLYIAKDGSLTIERTLKRLERKKLQARALLDPQQTDNNAQLGVASAFDLSWDVLTPEAQELGCYLSLFTAEPFRWLWVETAWIKSTDEDEEEEQIEDLEQLRNIELSQRSLLKGAFDSQFPKEYQYQLHSLIAQYFRAKLEAQTNATELKQKYCRVMNQIAQTISDTATLEEIQAVAIAIPHLSNVATELTEYIDDDNLIWSFLGLGGFYKAQGIYHQAEQWLEKCSTVCRERLGEQHPDVATSLNNLALLYYSQGRYEEAEPLYLQSLELTKQLLGEQHSSVGVRLNNLALLYYSQGRYEEAEPLYLQALEPTKQLQGEQHPIVATSLNNLAELYRNQGRYEEAEPLYLQSLELTKQLLGEQHPDVASSLNNLALLYYDQRRYDNAEHLYRQSLELYKHLLGEQHPLVALSLNNLAELYRNQGKYEEAEPLYFQSLELYKQLLGEQHPDVALSLNNLAELYRNQGKYEDAEPLYKQSLELYKQLLGEEHPHVATSLNNLALLYYSQEKYDDAEHLFLQALVIAETALGNNHPLTKTIQDNLNYLRKIKRNPQ